MSSREIIKQIAQIIMRLMWFLWTHLKQMRVINGVKEQEIEPQLTNEFQSLNTDVFGQFDFKEPIVQLINEFQDLNVNIGARSDISNIISVPRRYHYSKALRHFIAWCEPPKSEFERFAPLLEVLIHEEYSSPMLLKGVLQIHLKNDLLLAHYFKYALKKHIHYIFTKVLEHAIDLIPRTPTFKECLDDDKYYSLYDDKAQLKHITQFIEKVETSTKLQDLGINHKYFKHLIRFLGVKHDHSLYLLMLHARYIHLFIGMTHEEQFVRFISEHQNINNIRQVNYQRKKKFVIIDKIHHLKKKCDIYPISTAKLSVGNDFSHTTEIDLASTSKILTKSLLLTSQLNNLIAQLTEAILNSVSQPLNDLHKMFALRALTYKKLAEKNPPYSVDHWHHLKQAKADYIEAQQAQDSDDNFVFMYQKGRASLNLSDAIILYSKAINLNPYFVEAHYQRALAFYELYDLTVLHRIHPAFTSLVKDQQLLSSFLKIVTYTPPESETVDFLLNKLIKVSILNNAQHSLYLKLTSTNNHYTLHCNNEFHLLLLLHYGQKSMQFINKEKILLHHYHDSDFKKIIERTVHQEHHQHQWFQQYIDYFSAFHLFNKNTFSLDHMDWLCTLPKSRYLLITDNINKARYSKANNQISKALNECQDLLDVCNKNVLKLDKNAFLHRSRWMQHERTIKRYILDLRIKRASIYQKLGYLNCEEHEYLTVLHSYKGKDKSYPAIHYRLAIINSDQGKIKQAQEYINLAKKRSLNHTNKKIFKKIEKQTKRLNQIAGQPQPPVSLGENDRLITILNRRNTTKNDFQQSDFDELMRSGLEFYPSDLNTYTSLNDCLLYLHTDEKAGSIDDPKHSIDELTQQVNEHDHYKLSLIFIERPLPKMPVLLIAQKNQYKVFVGINKHVYAIDLVKRNQLKELIETVCYTILRNIIKKSFDQQHHETLDHFNSIFNLMISISTIKEFYERIIALYEEHIINAWLELADLDLELDLKEILNGFKKDFIESIKTFQEEQKRDVISLSGEREEHQKQQGELALIEETQKQLIDKLSHKEYVTPKHTYYDQLASILAEELPDVLKIKKISKVLDPFIPEKYIQYLEAHSKYTQDCVALIYRALEEPLIRCNAEQLEIEGYTICLSNCYKTIEEKLSNNKQLSKVVFNGTNIFFDTSLMTHCWAGKDLIMSAETIEFSNNTHINVSGQMGTAGVSATHQPKAIRIGEHGKEGRAGGCGGAGQNGGDILLLARQEIRNKEGLHEINVSGGKGGIGGNGGNGGDGMLGEDGKNGETIEPTSGAISDGYYRFSKGTPGLRGGHGGAGGAAGLGGYGGASGTVLIKEKHADITSKLRVNIDNTDNSALAATDGEPGEGGQGALGGLDGYDELRVKPGFGRTMIVEKKHGITLGELESPFLTPWVKIPSKWAYDGSSDATLRQQKQGKKGEKGLTAQMQLARAMQRSQSLVKQHHNETQILNGVTQQHTLHEQLQCSIANEKEIGVHAIEKLNAQVQAQNHALNIIEEVFQVASSYEMTTSMTHQTKQHVLHDLDHSSTHTSCVIKIKPDLYSTEKVNCKQLERRTHNEMTLLIQEKKSYRQKILVQLNDSITDLEQQHRQDRRALKYSFFEHYHNMNGSTCLDKVKINYRHQIEERKNKKRLLIDNKNAIQNVNYDLIVMELRASNVSQDEIIQTLHHLNEAMKMSLHKDITDTLCDLNTVSNRMLLSTSSATFH